MNIANLKIGHRLTIAFSLTTLLLAVVVVVGALGLRATSKEIDLTINDRYLKIGLLNQVKENVALQSRTLRDLLLVDAGQAAPALESVAARSKEIRALLDQLGGMLTAPQALALFKEMNDARAVYSLRDQMVAASRTATRKPPALLLEKVRRRKRPTWRRWTSWLPFSCS
jgi:methyl-accepting chemotaxis protein